MTMRLAAATVLAFALAGCSVLDPGQASPIFGYRVIDDRTLAVLANGAAGFETWVQTVTETSTSVVVEVRTRAKGVGAGTLVAQQLWLTVALKSPLGSRAVIDAIGDNPVGLIPAGSSAPPPLAASPTP